MHIVETATVTERKPNTVAHNEDDKNADTRCIGQNFHLLPTPIRPLMSTHIMTPMDHCKMFPWSVEQQPMMKQMETHTSLSFMNPYIMLHNLSTY